MPRNLSRQFVDGFDKAKVDTATKYQYTTFLKGCGKHCKEGSLKAVAPALRQQTSILDVDYNAESIKTASNARVRKIFRNVLSKSRSVPGAACSCGWGV